MKNLDIFHKEGSEGKFVAERKLEPCQYKLKNTEITGKKKIKDKDEFWLSYDVKYNIKGFDIIELRDCEVEKIIKLSSSDLRIDRRQGDKINFAIERKDLMENVRYLRLSLLDMGKKSDKGKYHKLEYIKRDYYLDIKPQIQDGSPLENLEFLMFKEPVEKNLQVPTEINVEYDHKDWHYKLLKDTDPKSRSVEGETIFELDHENKRFRPKLILKNKKIKMLQYDDTRVKIIEKQAKKKVSAVSLKAGHESCDLPQLTSPLEQKQECQG